MSRVIPLVILMVALFSAGCSTIPQSSPWVSSQEDPIIGFWISNQSGTTTFYRFWENGTFIAWSYTGSIHPKYSFEYRGQWESRGAHTYATEGPLIGYGDVTALVIWDELTLVYDSRQDIFSITAHPGQVFTRISHYPDASRP